MSIVIIVFFKRDCNNSFHYLIKGFTYCIQAVDKLKEKRQSMNGGLGFTNIDALIHRVEWGNRPPWGNKPPSCI